MASASQILNLAAEYLASGNSALAEQYATSVLNEDPNHAEALHLLGLIAQQKGLLNDAVAYLRRSLTADASNGLVWQHAGDLLLARGDLAGGIDYYEQALRLRPDFAEGHNRLGVALMTAGNLARAAECFQQARRLAPSYAQALNNLGIVLNKQAKWGEAAAAFEEALELRPDSPEVVYNLGNARFYQGDLPEAIACYRRALSLRPANAADILNSLATALRTQGHWDEASASYQETLRLRPGHAAAMHSLSEMAAQGRFVFPPGELDRLRQALVTPHCGEEEKRLYAFAVANVLHGQGAFDEAFRYYREANDLFRRHFKRRNAAFNARAHQAAVDRIIAEHGPAYFEKVSAWARPAELAVFIVGMPCSGTALLEKLLTAHPQVSRVGEAGSVVRFLMRSPGQKNAAPHTAQLLPDLHATETAAGNYLQHLTGLRPGVARILVNSRDNVLGLGMIATLFSGARVIHCRRDRRDVALACYFQYRPDLPFACSLEDIGAYARAQDKLMAHWAQVLPLTIHEVHFEALLQERKKTVGDLLVYCGLEGTDGGALRAPCVAGAESSKPRQQCAGPTANTSGPELSGAFETIGHWRHYRAHLDPLLKALEA